MEKDDFYNNIGKNIKKYRLEYNKNSKMTQEMLAEKARISVSLLSKLESSRYSQGISIECLYKISTILNVPLGKFLEINNE